MVVVVHPRIFERRPQLTEDDVKAAWEHSWYEAIRPSSPNYPEYLWIGEDGKGRTIEMVGTLTEDGWLIYHANTPLSTRTRREVEKSGRRRR